MTGSVPLPREPAVALAHALVDHLAAGAGIRVIAIKGPALSHHGLRAPRASVDADVLVEPGREAELQDLLARSGWRVRFEREMPHILERHSVTLLHPGWPVDIDLHWYFPGLHAAPGEVFETLWCHRETITVARRPVTGLDLVGSAVVAAAHCVRHPYDQRRRDELTQVCRRISLAPTEVRAELLAVAREVRGVAVLRDVLLELGMVPGSDDLTPDEHLRWRRYVETHELGSTGAWLQGLGSGGMLDRLRTAARAVWPTTEELRRMHPGRVPLDRRQRWRLRVARWRRGLVALPRTLRSFAER